MTSAAAGVAPTRLRPVEVLTKSAPASSAAMATSRINSGSASSPVSMIALTSLDPQASLHFDTISGPLPRSPPT